MYPEWEATATATESRLLLASSVLKEPDGPWQSLGRIDLEEQERDSNDTVALDSDLEVNMRRQFTVSAPVLAVFRDQLHLLWVDINTTRIIHMTLSPDGQAQFADSWDQAQGREGQAIAGPVSARSFDWYSYPANLAAAVHDDLLHLMHHVECVAILESVAKSCCPAGLPVRMMCVVGLTGDILTQK